MASSVSEYEYAVEGLGLGRRTRSPVTAVAETEVGIMSVKNRFLRRRLFTCGRVVPVGGGKSEDIFVSDGSGRSSC